MTKAGNGYMRTMAVEIAWGWSRFQPESLRTQWYQSRFGQGPPPEDRHCRAGPEVTDCPLALPEDGRTPGRRSAQSSGGGLAHPRGRAGPEERDKGFGLVWTTRCGARVRSANRLGGGVVHPGLHRRPERLQDRVCDPRRGHHGEKVVWGQRAPRITKPPAQVGGHAPVGPSTGTSMARGAEGNKKGLTSTAT
jgi:hypothetical protein